MIETSFRGNARKATSKQLKVFSESNFCVSFFNPVFYHQNKNVSNISSCTYTDLFFSQLSKKNTLQRRVQK